MSDEIMHGTCGVCRSLIPLTEGGKLKPHTAEGEPRPVRTVDACDGSEDYPVYPIHRINSKAV